MTVSNFEDLPLIGEGSHGKVYRLDEERCVKVCKNERHIQLEYEVLQHSQRFPQFARVYECQGNYMIREYFDGPNAEDYLRKNGLSDNFARQLVEIIHVFKQLGYTRLDCRLSHIIVTKGEVLKVIDPTRNMDKQASYPRKMLRGLAKLGYREKFLSVVKELHPDYHAFWQDK